MTARKKKPKVGDLVWDVMDLPCGSIVMDDCLRPGRVLNTRHGKRLFIYHENRAFPYIYLPEGVPFPDGTGAINYSSLKVLEIGEGWQGSQIEFADDPDR